MQKIEEYSRWVIDKVFLYFGNEALSYESASIHRLKSPTTFTKETTYSQAEQSRYETLFCELSGEALILALHLAVAQYLFPEFYHMLKGLTGQAVTMALALELTGENQKEQQTYTLSELKKQYLILRKYLCLEQKMENFLYTELYADERLVLYLAGDDALPDCLKNSCESHHSQCENYYAAEHDIKLLCSELSFPPNPIKSSVIQLCAPKGRGQKSLLRSAAAKKGADWIFVSYNKLKAEAGEELKEFLWLIQREARFYGFGICYNALDISGKEDKETFVACCLEQPLFTPICICTEEDVELMSYTNLPVRKIILPPCDSQERILFWKSFARQYQMELDCERYGVKYHLNPEDIKKIFLRLDHLYQSSMTCEQKDELVAELCNSLHTPPKKGSLHKISSFYTMQDLKLEPEKKKTLENICSYMRCQHQVYHTWNMHTKFSYGKNVTALFYGPPGTGKTMSAHVLSHELKMPLYQIDLSQVVDKYIGETEKHLEEIFNYAQKSNVILFFDEADAIFGKRTEVRETKDRYANTEVSYILQRIEQYNGIILLATNFRNNIDEAFLRRIKYVLEFEMPDAQMRKKIWESGFSAEVPLKDIDFDYLAEKVELSGGYIKNIILNAVFLGAKEGNGVGMKHILSAICSEYFKLGKVLKPQDFEKYAYSFYEEEKEWQE